MNINNKATLSTTHTYIIESNIANTKVTSVEPKINLELLPLLPLRQIVKLCYINTLLKFRLVSKTVYFNTTDTIISYFCKKKSFNNYNAFTLETYNKFIKPKLSVLTPTLIDSIEEYIEQFGRQNNFSNSFSRFLFYKMHHLSAMLPYTFATTKTLQLNNSHIRYDRHAQDYINFFDLSPCGNYCIAVNYMKIITLFDVTAEFSLKKLDTFALRETVSIETINFTPENNLCIIDSVEGCMSRLVLWKLDINKAENTFTLNKIAGLKSNKLIFKQAIMRCNDIKLILLTEPVNSGSSALELWELSENKFIKKCQLDKTIIQIPYSSHGLLVVINHIEHIAVNANANILAISAGKNADLNHAVCMLTISNEHELFRHEKIHYCEDDSNISLKKMIETSELFANSNLQLTPSGELCVFVNGIHHVTGLKRNNNTWYKIFVATQGNYYGMQLMPYLGNLLVHREHNDVAGFRVYQDIEILSFIKENSEEVIEDNPRKIISTKKYRNYFNKR